MLILSTLPPEKSCTRKDVPLSIANFGCSRTPKLLFYLYHIFYESKYIYFLSFINACFIKEEFVFREQKLSFYYMLSIVIMKNIFSIYVLILFKYTFSLISVYINLCWPAL